MASPPLLKATDLQALIHKLSQPVYIGRKTVSHKVLGSQFLNSVDLGAEYSSPKFEPRSFIDHAEGPQVVGRLSGYDVVLDRTAKTSRMTVSKRFREIQSPRLVRETQNWMDSFFGVDYPISLMGGRLVMHPEAFHQMLQLLENANALRP